MDESADVDKQFDTFTQTDRKYCKQAFAAFDKDHSGKIDHNELRIVLEMMGYEISSKEISRMLGEADAEQTG